MYYATGFIEPRQYHFIFLYNVMAFVMLFYECVQPFVFDGDFVVLIFFLILFSLNQIGTKE